MLSSDICSGPVLSQSRMSDRPDCRLATNLVLSLMVERMTMNKMTTIPATMAARARSIAMTLGKNLCSRFITGVVSAVTSIARNRAITTGKI